jgi:hypothetical protein
MDGITSYEKFLTTIFSKILQYVQFEKFKRELFATFGASFEFFCSLLVLPTGNKSIFKAFKRYLKSNKAQYRLHCLITLIVFCCLIHNNGLGSIYFSFKLLCNELSLTITYSKI